MPDLDIDGWELEDAEERHRAHPESFEIPSAEERASLAPGTLVKLLFLFLNEEDGKPIIDCERMWVRITERRNGGYAGQLENMPATSDVLAPGAIVEFGPQHIATVTIPRTDPRHPEYTPAPVAPEGPEPPSPPRASRAWWQFWR
jgi:hypothetical protein